MSNYPSTSSSLGRRFKVQTRMLVVSMTAIIGFVVVGALYFSTHAIEAAAEKDRQLALQKEEIVQSIAQDFLQARRREKDFFLRLNEKYIAKHNKVTAATTQEIAHLRELASTQTEVEHVDQMSTEFGRYVEVFANVTGDWRELGLTEKEGLRGKLRKAVHEVETLLKKAGQAELTVTMLMMRRHEKDFIIRLAPKYVARMLKRLAEFNTQLDVASMGDAERPAIRAPDGRLSKSVRRLREPAAGSQG